MKEYTVTFLGGDFKGSGSYIDQVFYLPRPSGLGERVHVGCCTVTHLTSENSKSFGGSAAAGVAGGLLLGPAGALAGALAGGNKAMASFTVELEDGRKSVGQAHPNLFGQILADSFTATCRAVPQPKAGDGAKGCIAVVAVFAVAIVFIVALMKSCGLS